jgi:hypothetical protein
VAKCCSTDYRRLFNGKYASRDAKRYRERGLTGSSRALVTLAGDVRGASILDVGGGVGAIEIELLAVGAERATSVELSGGYEAATAPSPSATSRDARRAWPTRRRRRRDRAARRGGDAPRHRLLSDDARRRAKRRLLARICRVMDSCRARDDESLSQRRARTHPVARTTAPPRSMVSGSNGASGTVFRESAAFAR